MSFTVHLNPDFVQFSIAGVWCLDCGEFTPGDQERCLSCGSSAVTRVEAGSWLGGLKPKATDTSHVEQDVSTGMIGYTRLDAADLAAWNEERRADRELVELVESRLAEESVRVTSDDDLIRAAAQTDPLIAALARRLGIA